ncbi:spore protease YyaC [Bacillus suaedaesalsae]|uniref:Spore protease YyaC n=1 Tax=Bacillus suaedaesalsae TaxID=2810349 RepID=A0ABS2DEN5_9BACI|nr:spore protease YyaC [Bacillus suaedaesalsae]MBM6616925.1 spore protease YyaC [Bacillus suaedaesalsae]
MNLRPKIFEKLSVGSRILFDDDEATRKIASQLMSLFPTQLDKQIAVVCIGTDRSTGDALGPLIGTKLEESGISFIHVFGTLENPIHAVNLEEQLTYIKDKLNNPFILAIDACLGRLKNVGCVTVATGPVKPGAGVKKELPPVGDIHITGIVNVSGFMEYFVLQNTRLNLVMKMATTISDGILEADRLLKRKQLLARYSLNKSKSI